jgi:hypothetical protein
MVAQNMEVLAAMCQTASGKPTAASTQTNKLGYSVLKFLMFLDKILNIRPPCTLCAEQRLGSLQQPHSKTNLICISDDVSVPKTKRDTIIFGTKFGSSSFSGLTILCAEWQVGSLQQPQRSLSSNNQTIV